MKILVVNTVPTEKNGITNIIFNYLEMVDHKNIQMDVLMINDADTIYKNKVKRYGGNPIIIKRSLLKCISYFYKLFQLIKESKYDAVHIHGNSHTMVLELLAAKLGKCKIRITHSHNTTCNSIFIHKILTPLFNSLYTHGLACSVDAGKWLYGNKRVFTIVNNCVNTSQFAYNSKDRMSLRQKLGLSENEILIGNVGHFWGDVKNQSFVIKVFKELYSINKCYRLCLIGDGAMRISKEQQVETLGLKHAVFFIGNINNVNIYLNAIDFILMPSLYEGLPLTLIEQQVNGLQCLCSDSITKEVDKTGNIKFLSLKQSAFEWAQEIIQFINIDKREFRSNKAVEDIKHAGYSIQEEAKKLQMYYNNVLNN